MELTFDAWEVRHYGGPDVLTPVSRAMPNPGPGEILVRVRASAVTRADGMMRAGRPVFARLFLGWSRPRAGLSGTCFAGDVIAVGKGVTQWGIGTAVFGESGLQFGANATHICVPADGSVVAKPETLTYEEAATMFDGAMTSWHFLTRVAQLQADQKVLILGGSGSLGSAAIQFAHAMGADVTATSSTRNLQLVESLGAGRSVDYTYEDPLKGHSVYNVVFDTLGISSFSKAKRALVENGRYVCPVLGMTLLRDMLWTRTVGQKRALFAAAGMQSPARHREEIAEILDLVADGRFAPVMDRTYPLTDLDDAHRYVETHRKRGNVVVV